METLFKDYPVLASAIAWVIFFGAGAIDLLALGNEAVAFLFWGIGFFVVLAPLINMPSFELLAFFLIILLLGTYVVAVHKTYHAIKGKQQPRP